MFICRVGINSNGYDYIEDAVKNGADVDDGRSLSNCKGYSYWWLRSTYGSLRRGNRNNIFHYLNKSCKEIGVVYSVSYDGNLSGNHMAVDYSNGVVRLALWINLFYIK